MSSKFLHEGFVRGVFWTVAELCSVHDLPTVAEDILLASGFTLEDARRAHVDPHDLQLIGRGMKTNFRKFRCEKRAKVAHE